MAPEARRRSKRLSKPQAEVSNARQSLRRTSKLRFYAEEDEEEVIILTKPSKQFKDTSPVKKPPRTPNVRLHKEEKEVIPTKPPKDFKEPTSPVKKPPRTPKKTKSTSDDCVTPPKQKKLENEENVTPPTPSGLLEKLSLGSAEKNRRKLFEDSDVFTSARRALHSTCPTAMPGREKELEALKDFILGHINGGTSGTLYISGPPGTGKTASLNLILENVSQQIRHVYVNCTSIKSSGAIFARIARDLGAKAAGKSEKDHVGAIEGFLRRSHKPILLVLDEIDQLESKNQSVLYTIFEWPAQPKSKLILIGIANALDLTDRVLPRLQARCELKPELMHFAPYSRAQIMEIFTSRLKEAAILEIFSPQALFMLASKVATVSGDVRRALDIGRRVIELIDRKKKGENVLRCVENLADELEESKIVEHREVMDVLNNVYGTTQKLEKDENEAFPLQQKIVICSLLLVLNKAKNKDVTIGRLHDVYRRVCSKRNIQGVDHGEFVGLCSLIETRGIVKVIKKKDSRLSKINLVWDEEEVGDVLRDKQLMSSILQDVGCLGKM